MLDLSKDAGPSLEDYIAGSLVSCSFVVVWGLILGSIKQPVNEALPLALVALSYMIYSIGGAFGAYLVTGRAPRRHVIVGLKLAIGAWITSVLILPPLTAQFPFGTAVTLLPTLLVGGVVGALVRRKLEARKGLGPAARPSDSER